MAVSEWKGLDSNPDRSFFTILLYFKNRPVISMELKEGEIPWGSYSNE